MPSSNEIRKQFIKFFSDKGHEVVPSAPLVPANDPTLLFTNAGMNQFKNVFLGKGNRDYVRVVNSQKCLRAGGKHNDLEEVGKDDYHHTFFEMLGNWSFGDYHKKEAIEWAWELLTKVWKIPKNKLYATVHHNDDESFQLWQEVTDLDKERILKFGDKHNFWEMADIGPCGPCSEIHYDRGVQHCQKIEETNHKCEINGGCGRYVEIWNLVFIQYNRLKNRELVDLPQKHVDTGAGFERLVSILQNKFSNYETDLFMPIIKHLETLSCTKYEENKQAFRVISDHIRALTFAIADGVLPSNEGRGYVIRRILRRAARFGRLINLHNPFLYQLLDDIIEIMGEYYPELIEKREHIKLVIKSEEERFNLTLDVGIIKFKEITEMLKPKEIISGKDVFKLYDTYGFPMDLTRIMAEEKGFCVDEKGFEKEMKKQRLQAKEASQFELKDDKIKKIKIKPSTKTQFVGYNQNFSSSKIEHFYIDEENNVVIVLDKTPFYAESGGQVADNGSIFNQEFKIEVEDVQKENDVFFHFGKLVSGKISKENEVIAEVNVKRRNDIARNHTATHLLHAALRKVLGKHLHQKGSLVVPDRLRFDFTHFKALSKEELEMVEKIVNEKIRENLTVNVYYDDLENARKKGAMALFGEKYEKKVRVVEIDEYSLELCGGIHCKNTGEIGLCKIISESSISAGVRRIEALTGEYAFDLFKEKEVILDEIQSQFKCSTIDVVNRIEKLFSENKQLKKQLEKLEKGNVKESIDKLIAHPVIVQGIKIIAGEVKVKNIQQLRESADYIKNKIDEGIGILGANIDDKASLICIVSSNLQKRFPAGKLVNKVAQIVGGKGGGRPDMAMAGGRNVGKIKDAIAKVTEIVKNL
ncbi:MAG: alanine--tRNA ligase [Candidatus Cloacimonetes bacterium]|nr:alanine--tRNA ligase [Candidatus Cloacimonadota bacterium]